MKKTVLITGTSSGIGKATVLEFAKMGWNVIATQRHPENELDFKDLPNVKLCALDVTNLESIKNAISLAEKDFGKIDVVVNNAGYGVDGAFEAMSDDIIEKTIAKFQALPYETTSSMHNDFKNGKSTTELSSLTAYVISECKKYGLPSPTYSKLYAELALKSGVMKL